MPESSTIKRILPIPFRSSYSHVNAIIDAFEIQIQKPSDPEYQSLTWSG
ncbi:cytochrome P450 9G3, partial [Danaus plexippus plexippus]